MWHLLFGVSIYLKTDKYGLNVYIITNVTLCWPLFSNIAGISKTESHKSLTEMTWYNYVEIKSHRATSNSLNLTFLPPLWILHTLPWARITSLSYSPTPILSNIFQDYIFSQDATQASHPSRSTLYLPVWVHGLSSAFHSTCHILDHSSLPNRE